MAAQQGSRRRHPGLDVAGRAGRHARRRWLAQRPGGRGIRRQGCDRCRGHAHPVRLACHLARAGAVGRKLRGAVARGGRHPDRQDGDGGVRLRRARPHPQPQQRLAHAGRIVQRFGGGGSGRHGRYRPGYANGRVNDPAGGVLRRGRLQAHLRPRPPAGHERAVRLAGHDRLVQPHRGAIPRGRVGVASPSRA
ncbi:hypothetical protein D3C72_1347350 [compost metagenome]